MSRRKQRGPLLKGALDVLELPVPDLEAGGQQRKGGLQVFHRLHAITEQHACRTIEHRASTFWCVSVSAGFHHTCEGDSGFDITQRCRCCGIRSCGWSESSGDTVRFGPRRAPPCWCGYSTEPALTREMATAAATSDREYSPRDVASAFNDGYAVERCAMNQAIVPHAMTEVT